MGTKLRFGIIVTALEVQFWFPVWLLFLLDRGFTIGQAALADAVFRIVATIGEVPAGWLSDRIGRKQSLYLTLVGTAVTFFLIAAVTTMPGLILAWTVWGVLWALVSGLLTAYGWELGHDSAEDGAAGGAEYVRVRRICAAIAMLVSLVSAGSLYEVSMTLPFTLTAVLALAVIPLAVSLPDVSATQQHQARVPVRAALTGGMRTAIAAGAIVLVAGWSIQMVFQPLGLEVGLSPANISFLFAGFAVAQLVGAWLVGRVRWDRDSVLVLSVAGLALMCFGVWAPGLHQSVALLSLVTLGLFYAVGTTYCDIWVSELSTAKNRAMMLSLVSLTGGIVMVGTRPLLGLIADAWDAHAAFGVWAVVCAALTFALWVVLKRGRTSIT